MCNRREAVIAITVAILANVAIVLYPDFIIRLIETKLSDPKENYCLVHREEMVEETNGWIFWNHNTRKLIKTYTIKIPCKTVKDVMREGDKVERISTNNDYNYNRQLISRSDLLHSSCVILVVIFVHSCLLFLC